MEGSEQVVCGQCLAVNEGEESISEMRNRFDEDVINYA